MSSKGNIKTGTKLTTQSFYGKKKKKNEAKYIDEEDERDEGEE